MLQKFLFVGVGGSGGATVRILREQLSQQLQQNGYRGGIPAAWQFVHVDVPLSQGRRPENVPLLPEHNYVALAEEGLDYADIDTLLCSQGQGIVQYAAGWRPNPLEVNVNPEIGGGQFRSVGRVIAGARLAAARQGLRSAVSAMRGESANQEFSRVCEHLTEASTPSGEPLQVIVLASLAGGSGAGFVSDVCDLLCQLVPTSSAKRLVAILYAPEIFEDLEDLHKVGVNPNALGALSELLNGYWNNEPYMPEERALLRAAGAAADGDARTRGPRVMYIVGRDNGRVKYSGQYEVYGAVAGGLAVWATNPDLQNDFLAAELGNWTQRAAARQDNSGLCEALRERPLSSFGCASVAIGLDRFARYSAERLARLAVDHVLKGHVSDQDRRESVPDDDARAREAQRAFLPFMRGAGLSEQGPDNNQIVDIIRGKMTEAQARAEIRTDLRSDLLTVVVERWPIKPPPTAADVAQRVEDRLAERWQRYFATYESRYLENAAAWTSSLQTVVMERVADVVADYGGPVAADVLEEAIEQLTQLVVDELAESQKQRDRWVNDVQRRIAAAIGRVSGPLPSNHPGVGRAVEAALDALAYRLEGFVYELAIDLIRDVADNVLAPLRKAIVDGFQGLRIDFEGTAVRRSTVQDWPVGTAVPLSFTPARNELLLEPVTQYPELFETQVRAQMGGVELGNAVQRARRELITGEKDGESGDQMLISREAGWVPQHDKLRGPNHPIAAQYKVFLHDDDLLGRARNWITRSDTPMGRFLRQSLDRYLNDADLEEQVRAARLVEFDRQLAQTVALSRPLVAIDAAAQTDIHGVGVKYVERATKFPFTANHPGRAVVRKVLANVPPEKFDSLFGPTDRERIDVFTFLDAPVQPVVMDSLVRPIRQQWEKDRGRAELGGFWTWRRTRPLRWFVPCSPTVRRNIVKGWFVARFLGQIHCHKDDPIGEPTEVWTPRGRQAFPFPLLGPPLRDRDEWLPAVLESLALTVVGESFRGYQRLIDLAVSSGAPDMVNRGGELVSWIRAGSPAENAPIPMPMLAGPAQGSPDERATTLLGNIQRWEEHYGRYRAHRPSRDDGLQISRAWELRDDIVEALADLHRVVEATRTTAPFDDPVAPG